MMGTILTDTNTATGDSEVELTLSEISASIRGLYDHLLASNRGRCEREPN
jgi:hypothetical protein